MNSTPLPHHVSPPHHPKKLTGEFYKVLFLRTLGNFLIFSSLFFLAKTFYQPLMEEARYYINSQIEREYVVAKDTQEEETIKKDLSATTEKGGLAKLLNLDKVEILKPEDPEFSIVIPKIGANAKVQANVDAANEQEYLDALKNGIAHAKGTAFPGEGGHMFYFAHSTDYVWNVGNYNAVFYLLYKLEPGDEINIFYKGVRHRYKVIEQKVVEPTEVEYITRKTDGEFITLQTCWPPGTTLQRLLVFAQRIAE